LVACSVIRQRDSMMDVSQLAALPTRTRRSGYDLMIRYGSPYPLGGEGWAVSWQAAQGPPTDTPSMR
jgi:hypothetical protein